jgi:phospholipid/cholesterol/gamma-HCH transport system permease protein
VISYSVLNLPATHYWTTSWQALDYSDIAQGLLKPFAFAFAVSLVGCYFGLRTTGGTQGVGRATTQSVVVSLIVIFILTFFITRVFTSL